MRPNLPDQFPSNEALERACVLLGVLIVVSLTWLLWEMALDIERLKRATRPFIAYRRETWRVGGRRRGVGPSWPGEHQAEHQAGDRHDLGDQLAGDGRETFQEPAIPTAELEKAPPAETSGAKFSDL